MSKFLSYVLRHKPEDIGIALDKDGWVSIALLISSANRAGYQFDRAQLDIVVKTNDKKRFTISDDGLFIRAAQGHSSQQVDIEYIEKAPPTILYHGTADKAIISIRSQGLTPQKRHYVHLTDNFQTAEKVGKRYGRPIILEIQATKMFETGFKFYQADNGVWLTSVVPIQYINELS